MVSFGTLLKAYRVQANCSMSQLAKRAGLDHSYVSRLEAGTRMPTAETVRVIAGALQLSNLDRDKLLDVAGYRVGSIHTLMNYPLLGDLDVLYSYVDDPTKQHIESTIGILIDYARQRSITPAAA